MRAQPVHHPNSTFFKRKLNNAACAKVNCFGMLNSNSSFAFVIGTGVIKVCFCLRF